MQDPQGFCAKEEGIAGGWGVSNSFGLTLKGQATHGIAK